ncbi:nuclear transport factor 2 family protein [Microlunatus parietis]|uniref:Ketosteroid isomerase-like protein n=1 Tax=Microlunatus parietis TaxID=682979 RepID=A0A7Y9I7R5_9ACTN|nr:nuclear transport factor 2 family protein [Microlunatus parietis]NYE71868.1 ketosteroid isomerase-like protein [Microlunatus parietis]
MSDAEDVLAAARRRAEALSTGDADGLRASMHEECRWTSFAGLVLDRDDYIRRNTTTVGWAAQEIVQPLIRVIGDCAVLTGTVIDIVAGAGGEPEEFRLLITMTWIRDSGRWRLLAGHAGPRLRAAAED